MQNDSQRFAFTVSSGEAGSRLDLFLVHRLAAYSRSALLKLIRGGAVLVDERAHKPGYRIEAGEQVEVVLSRQAPSELIPERIDFTILFEDESLLVIVKPSGLVVHPAAGHQSGTLAHGLAFYCDTLPGLTEQRPGIVHRLDKDTSGIMLVAKTDHALRRLSDDFRNRDIEKIYHALLLRSPAEKEGRMTAAIGRHPVRRKKMAVRVSGRYAATRWRVLEFLPFGMCFAELGLETGRTHQIRVHMASLGCPVAGDVLYGGKVPAPYGFTVKRQLLHASTITFRHPVHRKSLTFTAPLQADMMAVLEHLQEKGRSIQTVI